MWMLVSMALAGDPPAIEAIRARWNAVEAGTGPMCEDLEEPGQVRLDQRIDWNPNDEQRPAIGPYADRIDVYRTWCHPEFVGPVVKVVHHRLISVREDTLTVLYDAKGAPLFVHDQGAERPEVRTYFDGGRAIRVVSRLGDRTETTDAPSGPVAAYAAGIYALAQQLAARVGSPPEPPRHPWASP
ncbi:MAG: hypothetical protein R3F61_36580 [Myxococcota bacterium]